MKRVTYNFRTSMLMRVGSTVTIQDCYDNRSVLFSCPANWINYALTEKNETTGDVFECVFAQLLKGDPRINNITDIHGKPMGDHLLILENAADGSCLLRFIPTILKPVLCFYSFDIEKIRREMNTGDAIPPWIAFNLDEYRKDMEYSVDDSSFLFVTDPVRFFEDLKKAIPRAVKENKYNLTSKRFYGEFNAKEPIACKDVDYHRHIRSEIFFDRPGNQEELFWKLPKYENQSELRVTIPHLNFVQTYDPNEEYDRKRNTLKVFLPHFQEYTTVVSAKDAHALYFGPCDDAPHTNSFAILKMTWDELIEQTKVNKDSPILY